EDHVPRWKKLLLWPAVAVTAVSLGFLTYFLIDEGRGPAKSATIDVGEVDSDIPLRSAERWGGEVRGVLADSTWMKLPETKRREQLERALRRLADRQVGVLVLEDDAKRPRATAQLFGRPPKLFVRFY